MLNLSNEAIRRMYVACKENDCFPGDLPTDEYDRNVSIHAILEGLGLLTDGMLPFEPPFSPTEESISRRQSQSNPSGRPPRTGSGSSNPSLDGIETSSLHNVNSFTSNNSIHSSTSYQSFDDQDISPTAQTHPFEPGQQHNNPGPSFLQNLDFLSFGPPNTTLPMIGPANTNGIMQPLRNDFLFPWPGTFAAAMDMAEYHHQSQ
jgi:hypothetical protein